MRYVAVAALSLLVSASQWPAAAAAQPPPAPPPTKTTAMAAAVAMASQDAGAAAPAGSNAPGADQAADTGIPIDTAFLGKNPEVAEMVPLGPPVDDGNRFNFDFGFSGKKNASAIIRPSTSANSRTAAVPPKPILATTGFIRAKGRYFSYAGKPIYPSGTSWYNILQLEAFTETEIIQMLRVHWDNGVRVLRIFGHIDGPGRAPPTRNPIQPKVGVFSEAALRRYDLVVHQAGKVGIRLILTLTNFWENFGGVQFYVDNLIGKGKDPSNFYKNEKCRYAYKQWAKKIVTRVNTITKRRYRDDPTIFAWELCNECHTTDNFEISRKMQPGSLVYDWQVEMGRYLKFGLKVKSMVTNGNEGYRARGKYDPYASITYPFRNWMNTGLKGEDFNRMLRNQYMDFATIHAYPFNLGIPAKQASWITDAFIGDRAYLAAAANKPLLLEEYGSPRDYIKPRDSLFKMELGAAAKFGVAGTVAWSAWARYGDDKNYDFSYQQTGGPTVLAEMAWQRNRNSASKSPFSYACPCTNTQPSNSNLTCALAVSQRKCCSSEILGGNDRSPFGFCQLSCGRCLCAGGTQLCAKEIGGASS